jgi:hypothetical protein
MADPEREALLARIAKIRGDSEMFADATVDELRRAATELEQAHDLIRSKGRMGALWSLPLGDETT